MWKLIVFPTKDFVTFSVDVLLLGDLISQFFYTVRHHVGIHYSPYLFGEYIWPLFLQTARVHSDLKYKNEFKSL